MKLMVVVVKSQFCLRVALVNHLPSLTTENLREGGLVTLVEKG